MREKALDALLMAAIKIIVQLEALIGLISGLNDDRKRRAPISTELREIAETLEKLPSLQNDLYTLKKRLRGMLSFDPDKTPRAIHVPPPPPTLPEGKRFSPVEETAFGLGEPPKFPKKSE